MPARGSQSLSFAKKIEKRKRVTIKSQGVSKMTSYPQCRTIQAFEIGQKKVANFLFEKLFLHFFGIEKYACVTNPNLKKLIFSRATCPEDSKTPLSFKIQFHNVSARGHFFVMASMYFEKIFVLIFFLT